MASTAALAWVPSSAFGTSLLLLIVGLQMKVDPGVRRRLRALERAPVRRRTSRGTRFYEGVGGSRLGLLVAGRLDRGPRSARRAELAGSPWSRAETAGRVVVSSAASAAATLPLALVWQPAVVLIPLSAVLGARLPAFTLTRRGRRRQARIEAQVPELVELLVAASESGLPPPTAFVRASEAIAAPLGTELRAAVAEIELGSPWRSALDDAVRRTSAPGLASLTRCMERSHRVGASVRGSLKALVDDLRAERRARAEERARRAPVKMLFPLVFLILPAFLLLTVGPVLLSTVRSLH
jgi:Flp pilus assembly protein TadB